MSNKASERDRDNIPTLDLQKRLSFEGLCEGWGGGRKETKF